MQKEVMFFGVHNYIWAVLYNQVVELWQLPACFENTGF